MAIALDTQILCQAMESIFIYLFMGKFQKGIKFLAKNKK